jgi:hypothetical protein
MERSANHICLLGVDYSDGKDSYSVAVLGSTKDGITTIRKWLKFAPEVSGGEVDREIEKALAELVVDVSCSSCKDAKWGTNCPLPGVLIMQAADGNWRIQRCDECSLFATDDEAHDHFCENFLNSQHPVFEPGLVQDSP